MPTKKNQVSKKSVKKITNSQSRKNVKSRKLQQIAKKSLEAAFKCGIKINMVIYDPSTNRMEQRYTEDGFDLDKVNEIKRNREIVGRKNFKFKSQNI